MGELTESIEVRCTVFRQDDPVLYDYITNLPPSRQRRRAALLGLMRAGIGQNEVVLPVPTSGPHGLVPLEPVISLHPGKGLRRGESSPSPAEEGVVREVIDADDLFEVFGKKTG